MGKIAVCIAAEMIRVYRSLPHQHVDAAIKEALQQTEEKILATVVATAGVTSRQSGASMVVYPHGKTVGTVGGGSIEYEAIQKCLALLASPSTPGGETVFTNHTGGEMTIRFERK